MWYQPEHYACRQSDEGGREVTMDLQILADLPDTTLEQPFRLISY